MKSIIALILLVVFFPMMRVDAQSANPSSVPSLPSSQTLVVPYDSLMEDRVSIDGFVDIEDEEYPGKFSDPATGINVNWGYDDSLIYVALEAKGKGWLAIGFGSPVMDGANMFLGYYTDDSAMVVNYVGVKHTHAPAKGNENLLEDWEVDYDDETNITTVEFAYPLRWEGLKGVKISGLVSGEVYDLILARNPKSPAFTAKHSQKSHYRFTLVAKPEPKIEILPSPMPEEKPREKSPNMNN